MPSDIIKKLGLCLFILMPAYAFAADTPFDAASTVWLMVFSNFSAHDVHSWLGTVLWRNAES